MSFLSLSDEILLHIANYCSSESVISLSETCRKFDNLLQDKIFCENLVYTWSLRIQRNRFVKFLENGNRALVISSLDITDVYWIPSGIIRTILLRMTNLKELLAAGTQLSWGHLHQTIKQHLPNLERLSWTWDDRLEVHHRDLSRELGTNGPENYGRLKTVLKEQLLRLRCLLIHIPINPVLSKFPDAVMCSHTALTYLISLCKNLEKLYIVSWPRDPNEESCTTNINFELFDPEMNFPNLHTVVFSAAERPRISTVKLYNYFITNFIKNKIAPKTLWIDHPLLSLSRKHRESHGEFTNWNELDLSQIENYCFPLIEEAFDQPGGVTQKHFLNKCKTLQIIEGLPRKLSISGMFDGASNLESFCCKSFNHRMDWTKFAKLHPKLREVNACYDKEICSTDFCIALASLSELRNVAVPIESLIEIRDVAVLSEYRLAEVIADPEPSTSSKSRYEFDDPLSLFGKRKRVGLQPTTGRVSSGICGLDLLTQSCPHVKEFEIGFTKNDASVGRILVDSLFSISKWKNLTRLTLDSLPIHNGKFLIEIAKSCNLESLRLNRLGSSGKCTYNVDLCASLAYCKNLRDFRFEQHHYGNTSTLLTALEKCQKIRRILIYCKPNDIALVESSVISLFRKCEELVMFHIIQGGTPTYVCENLRIYLERTFKPKRPNLNVYIKNCNKSFDVPTHPSVHYRQMVLYSSQVCQAFDMHKIS